MQKPDVQAFVFKHLCSVVLTFGQSTLTFVVGGIGAQVFGRGACFSGLVPGKWDSSSFTTYFRSGGNISCLLR